MPYTLPKKKEVNCLTEMFFPKTLIHKIGKAK